jgi:hypothetical protein
MLLASTALGQLKSELPRLATPPELKSVANVSWLNPQRFSMNHSFSVSFMSGSGLASGASMSVYSNQMSYLISKNMLLNSNVYFVQPGMNTSPFDTNPLQIYYQAGIDWQPRENMFIHFGFSNLPSMARYYRWNRSSYTPYNNPWSTDQSTVNP